MWLSTIPRFYPYYKGKMRCDASSATMEGAPGPGSTLDKRLDKVVQPEQELVDKRVIRQGVQMPVAF
ncbi:hypothetical protein GCM10027085_50720 [Spirosoma aerophilum]